MKKKQNHDLNILVKQLLSQNKVCAKCEILKTKNNELSKAIQNFTNNKKKNFQNRKGETYGKNKKDKRNHGIL